MTNAMRSYIELIYVNVHSIVTSIDSINNFLNFKMFASLLILFGNWLYILKPLKFIEFSVDDLFTRIRK